MWGGEGEEEGRSLSQKKRKVSRKGKKRKRRS